MRKSVVVLLLVLVFITSIVISGESMIIYTASQSWNSRIYILNMDGSLYNYYEYEYYIFSDMEVVNNEVYVVDWVAPRLYKFYPESGNLEVIVDDWSLLCMYDVAFDGTYFYIDEWSLNRYELDGDYDSTASFDLSTRGGAWNGEYYWTLDDNGNIQCWDISDWDEITEISENNFSAPSQYCKGLWFDGEYFWTAESKDNLGYIYSFDYDGSVIEQWLEPAFSGYSAVVIEDFDTSIENKSLGSIKSIFR
jgi:hypothetical protein